MGKIYELNLEGFVSFDGADRVIFCKKKNDYYCSIDVVYEIRDFLQKNKIGTAYETDGGLYGLGKEIQLISDCNISMYFTKSKKTLEEAMLSVDTILYGGDYEAETDYDGYSEFTITDCELTTLTIGNHDLKEILKTKENDYCHFRLEIKQ